MIRKPVDNQTDKATSPARTRTPSTGRTLLLAHGGGGQLTDDLIRRAILPRLNNDILAQLTDSALLPSTARNKLAFTIDSYVVTPWRFPGGDIGRLAVCGTVNDLAVAGAIPTALALSLIAPEGFPQKDLEAILDSIAEAADDADVHVVTGDTKVVGRHAADGIYITTAGVGHVPPGRNLSHHRIQPGDRILINGSIGEHGLAVMLAREMPEMHTPLRSDVAPLNHLLDHLLETLGPQAAFLRDATRSGLAGLVTDIAERTGFNITLDEASIPLRPHTEHAADMLGLDPLEIANEGKAVAFIRPDAVDVALRLLRAHPLGRDAAVIGRVESDADGLCQLVTDIGGRRILQKPYGQQLPRIC